MKAIRHKIYSLLSFKAAQPVKPERRWSRLLFMVLGVLLLNAAGFFFLNAPLAVHASSSSTHVTTSVQESHTQLHLAVGNANSSLLAPPPQCTSIQQCQCLYGNLTACSDCPSNFTANSPSIQNPIAPGSTLFFCTPFNMTIGNAQVIALQRFVSWIVDACVVVILVLTGLRLMVAGTTFRFANAIETVPGVLLALVVAHLSMPFMTLFLGLNNVLSVGLYNYTSHTLQPYQQQYVMYRREDVCDLMSIPRGACGIAVWTTLATTAVTQPWLIGVLTASQATQGGRDFTNFWVLDQPVPASVSVTPTSLDFTNIWNTLGSLFDITGLMVKILTLMLMGQVIARILQFDLYIISGSAGIAAWSLPAGAGQSLTRAWFKGFGSLVMVQFLQVAGFILIQFMLNQFAVILNHQINPDPNNPILNPLTLVNIMRISLLWFVLRIPSLLGTAPMRNMVEAGQAMQQAAVATIGVTVAEVQTAVTAVGGIAGAGVALAA